MAFELAQAFVSIKADGTSFTKNLAGIKRDFLSTVTSLSKMAGLIGIPATALGTFFKLKEILTTSVDVARESSKVQKDMARMIEATGHASGFSAKELEQYAAKLESITGVRDDEIKQAMTRLMLFRNVSGDVFKAATREAINLAEFGLGSVESNLVMLGRAFQDPIQGFQRLKSVGVILNEQQKKTIEYLQKEGRLREAQLKLLEAIMVPQAVATPAKRMANEIDEVYNKIGRQLLPALKGVKTVWLEILKIVHDVVTLLGIPWWAQWFKYLGAVVRQMQGRQIQIVGAPGSMTEKEKAAFLDSRPRAGGIPIGLPGLGQKEMEAMQNRDPETRRKLREMGADELAASRRENELELERARSAIPGYFEARRAASKYAYKQPPASFGEARIPQGLSITNLRGLNEAFQDALNNTSKNPAYETNELMKVSVYKLEGIANYAKNTADNTAIMVSQAKEQRERAVAND